LPPLSFSLLSQGGGHKEVVHDHCRSAAATKRRRPRRRSAATLYLGDDGDILDKAALDLDEELARRRLTSTTTP
jgi:hypothetical protein